MNRSVLTLAMMAGLSVSVQATADSAATTDAKKLLQYFAGLPDRSENRMISGQFLGYAFQVSSGNYDKEIKALKDSTGKWAAMVATDFAFTSSPYPVYCSLLVNYWKAGHLIALSHHIPKPTKAISVLPTDSAWKAQLDSIAVRLKYLSDRGVVVLWRPFHEMNGTWFWYGPQSRTNDEFKALWRHMFTYFTKTKGLHNLLWVYSPDDGPGKVLDDYPGDAYVDIVSLDKYNNYASSLTINNYTQITSLGKPFGLGEFSPKGASSTDPRFETRLSWKVLTETGLKTKYPKTAFFLAWDRQWGMGFNLDAKALLTDPWVVTRDELDWKNQTVPVSIASRSLQSDRGVGVISGNRVVVPGKRSGEGVLMDGQGRFVARMRLSDGIGSISAVPDGMVFLRMEDGAMFRILTLP
jgi:mannan endo-1,4-beta-mannosidase